MKINQKMLKQLIKEELDSMKEAAPASNDIVMLQKYMKQYKISEFIQTKINTPQEFLALMKMILASANQLKPAQKSSILRALAGQEPDPLSGGQTVKTQADPLSGGQTVKTQKASGGRKPSPYMTERRRIKKKKEINNA